MRYIQKLKNYYDPIIQVLDFMHEQTWTSKFPLGTIRLSWGWPDFWLWAHNSFHF
jgi:hypothetical protein